ncbi:unnamed protein product [Vicia faba]|uniref:Uncharacterized protein n=1 Tax=Vicia faba TaxID=3906 RepID=A0AAV1A2X4_VICFA|nr:unnamed protein product [Vicia faba]
MEDTLTMLADISEMNDSVDSLNGFKILLQQSQQLEHELQLIHTWTYWSDIFHDGCRFTLANIYCYFYDNAMARRFYFISKAGEVACVDQQQQCSRCGQFNYATNSGNINIVSKVSKYICLIVHASIVGTQELVRINDGKKKQAPNIYVPMDSYWFCMVLTANYFQVSKFCTSLVVASLHREHGDDRVVRSESLLKVVGENVVWFRNLELNFLKRRQFNLKCVRHNYENDFIYVLIFECQNFSVVVILYRKMINWGNVRDAKILIKWKALPLKHDSCDCSSLRTRMFEGEDIVTGITIKY